MLEKTGVQYSWFDIHYPHLPILVSFSPFV